MPTLRDEITKTLLRIGNWTRSSRPESDSNHPDKRESRQYGIYRVIRRLGSGGMGQVYLALDTRLGRHVALKFLPVELTGDPELLARFGGEARTASSLNHPNIVTVHDFVELDGESILVTEFIEGVTLRNVIDRTGLSVEAAVQIAIQVASALAAAHAAGIVHRDLKPSNIMIRPDGYAKVIDFGLAKIAPRQVERSSGSHRLTKRGTVLGTVDYMSPEQARGGEVDARTDLWSLGVILYEAVTGQRPFSGETDSHVIVNILDKIPPPISVTSDLPPGLAAIIEHLLEKDRNRRYGAASELVSALENIQRLPDYVPSRSRRPAQKKRSPKWTAIVLVSAVAFIILGAIWLWRFDGKERLLGPSWFDVAGSRKLTYAGDVLRASVSPDGAYVAYASGSRTHPSLHLYNLRPGTDRVLGSTIGEYAGLTFSPDSKTLFFVVKDERSVDRLFAQSVSSSAPEPSRHILDQVDGPVTFSPDGQEFTFLRVLRDADRSTSQVFVATANNPADPHLILNRPSTQTDPQLAWLSKREAIASVSYPQHLNGPVKAIVSVFDLAGKALRTYVPDSIRSLYLPVALDGGSLLVFSGRTQGSVQLHLVQMSTVTGEFHETATDVVGFDSLSATADSQMLSSVRVDDRSTVYIADRTNLSSARQATRDSEYIPQITWADNQELIFPSARTGSVNLARLTAEGSVAPVSSIESCVQHYPEGVSGQSFVVFSSNCAHGGDDFNIWTMDLHSGGKRQLTSGSTYDYEPSLSPDGKWVVYSSWTSNVKAIWKIALDGTVPIRLSAGQGQRPFVSPDGQSVLCQIREPSQRWETAILSFSDGTVLRRLPQIPATSLARWSPEGKAIDYVNFREHPSVIRRQPLSGGPSIPLTAPSDDPVAYFSWNGDGTKLAYVVSRHQGDVVLLYRRSHAH